MSSKEVLRNLLIGIILVTFLVACGGRKPNPIAEYKIDDDALTCRGIKAELAYIDTQVSKLIPEQKKTGKNVALGVTGWFLIVPWFFMDFSKAERIEIEAYQKRYLALQKLSDKKECYSNSKNKLDGDVTDADISDQIVGTEQADANSETENTEEQVAAEADRIPVKNNDVAKKLEVLRDLHEQGLISDKEYAERREAVLDQAFEY